MNLSWVFLVLISSMTVASNDHALFEKANKLYDQKKFQEALDTYQEIKSKGNAVLYNMGNACYKKNDFFNAMIYWRRSLDQCIGAYYDTAYANHQVAAEKIGSGHSLSGMKVYVKRSFVFIIQFLFLFFWYIFLWFSLKRFKSNKAVVIIVLIGVALTGWFVFEKYYQETTKFGYLRDDTDCLSGPDEHYQKVAKVAKASAIIILDESGTWLKIQGDSQKGWVRNTLVSRV